VTPDWRNRRRPASPRERVVVPAPYRADITQYAIEEWFRKHCPGREYLLSNVDDFYNRLILAGSTDGTVHFSIREADSADLEMLARMIAPLVNKEQSLVEWIEMHDQTYAPDLERWYDICRAAGFHIIQVFVRERTKREKSG
jgi:hypothetical protein